MARILDQYGSPIDRQVLSDPQSVRIASLHHEVAEHPSRGLTPIRLAAILQQAEQGDLVAQHDLFTDMEEKDAHLYAEMSKRKRALLRLDWDVEPPPGGGRSERKVAAGVKDLLEGIEDIEDVILDLADAIGHGFSALEIEWQRLGATWLPKAIHHRPQRWFAVPPDQQNEIRIRGPGQFRGEPLQPFGWLLHKHRARSGYIARGGIHRTLAWPYLLKNYAIRDLAEFLEIFGLPLRLGKYPPGASKEEKADLMRAVVAIGHDAAAIMPEGMMIEFAQAAQAQGSNPFESMLRWCDDAESVALIGATLTTRVGSGGGSRALGEVHHEVMWDIVYSDCRQIRGTLTRDLLYPIAALNFATEPGRGPLFRFDTSETEEINVFSQGLQRLANIGVKIPEAWVRQRSGIPEPEEGEAVLAAPAAPEPGLPSPPAEAARRAALRSGKTAADNLDDADRLSDQIEDRTSRLLDDLAEPIRRLVESAGTLEEIRDGLDRLYPDMDEAALAAVLREALAAAILAGRYAVKVKTEETEE